MPGPVEEAGETARSAIDALKASPLLLGIMLLQVGTIALFMWVAHWRNEYEMSVNKNFSDQVLALIKQCGPIKQGEIPLPLLFPPEVPRDG